jgi:Amt family ammonium transporter
VEVAGEEDLQPHNITYVVLGTFIFWLGWLLFNAGSTMNVTEKVNRDQAELSMMNTILAPSVSGVVACTFKKYISKQTTNFYDV